MTVHIIESPKYSKSQFRDAFSRFILCYCLFPKNITLAGNEKRNYIDNDYCITIYYATVLTREGWKVMKLLLSTDLSFLFSLFILFNLIKLLTLND